LHASLGIRFSGFSFLALIVFTTAYSLQVIRFGMGFSKLVAMSHFYSHLLNIPDADVQSIPWHEVVTRLSHLRQTYPNTSISSSRGGISSTESKLDAHDVANRIMRQENYLVALFNKDVLNLNVPFPGLHSRPPKLTKTLEWNLSISLTARAKSGNSFSLNGIAKT
jgi:autophagy-related protein 9